MLKLVNLAGGLALLLLGRKLGLVPVLAVVLEAWPGDPAPYRLAPRPGWQAV